MGGKLHRGTQNRLCVLGAQQLRAHMKFRERVGSDAGEHGLWVLTCLSISAGFGAIRKLRDWRERSEKSARLAKDSPIVSGWLAGRLELPMPAS